MNISDSILLRLLDVFERQTHPAVYLSALVALFAAFAPIVTTYILLRRRDILENVLLLVAPFVLMGAVGIVLPLVMSAFLNDTHVLARAAKVLECADLSTYLTDNRLYLEILIPIVIFFIAMPLYSRMLIRRLERKRSILSIVFDCGQEVFFATWILITCVMSLMSGKFYLETFSDFYIRLFFYGIVAVAYKSAVCLFIFVYVEIFGARGRQMRKLNAAPDFGDNTLLNLETQSAVTENATKIIFRMVRRKNLFNFAFCMFPVVVSAFAALEIYKDSGVTPDGKSTMLVIFGAMFVYMLWRAIGFLIWVLFPQFHPLPRVLRGFYSHGDFEYQAEQFLKEYRTPVYKYSGASSTMNRKFVLTENFLIDESRLVMRVYSLRDITGIDGVRVNFRDGKHCTLNDVPSNFLHLLSRYCKR